VNNLDGVLDSKYQKSNKHRIDVKYNDKQIKTFFDTGNDGDTILGFFGNFIIFTFVFIQI